jgi:dienelactone hydrolase
MDKPTMETQFDRRTLLTGALVAGGALALPFAFNDTARAAVKGSSASTATDPVSAIQFFADPTLNFQALFALSAASYNASELGEVLSTINQVHANGDSYAAFYEAFLERGNELQTRAKSFLRAGHKVSAREAYLRATSYFDQALYFVLASSDPTRQHEGEVYQQMDGCWRAAAKLFTPQFEYVRIPYKGTKLPGWLLTPPGPNRRRPTIILNNGSDAQNIDLYVYGGRAALERGWNAFIFEGPGQGSNLFLHNMPFTVEWEHVVGSVLDVLVRRPDVSRDRIALMGWSFCGLSVVRAAAYERRIAALVADPGVNSNFTKWQQALGPQLIALLDSGNETEFNTIWDQVFASLPAEEQFTIQKRSEIFGQGSFYDRMHLAQQFTLSQETIARVKAPTLVIEADEEQFVPGQAQQVYEQLTTRKKLLTFTVAEGAQFHCEPMAPQLRNELMFNWLEDTLG